MRGSVRFVSIGGVPIRVHWSFAFLVVFIVASARGAGGASGSLIAESALWVFALFASVTIHELSHCAVARSRGLHVRDIVLLPIGGVSEIEGLPSSPRIERDVAIAGPLASVALGAGFAMLAMVAGEQLWPPALWSGSWLVRLAWLNLLLAGFNLIPALPMDGGRVLRAGLATRFNDVLATRWAATVAQVVGVAMMAAGFLYDWWLILIGAFVLMGASAERRSSSVRASLEGVVVGGVMTSDPTTVPAGVTVHEVAPWLWNYPGRALPVIDGEHYVGIVSMDELMGAGPWTTVGGICDRSAPVLDASQPVYPAAFEAFSSSRRSQLAVLSGGRVVGVVYRPALQGILRQVSRA
jgi:Zn-dependent protease